MTKFAQLIALYLLVAPVLVLGNTDYFEQVANLEARLETISVRDGPCAEGLFEPLIELARLHISELDYEIATDTLHRAQNIVHRNEGVYSPKQLEVIELLTRIALAGSDYKQANRQQKFTFFVTQHHLKGDDPEILFAYSEMAQWYMNTGQTRRARRLLKEAIELADQLEQNPLPLAILMSRARRLEGLCCSTKALVSVVNRVETSDPDTLAETYLELADTLIMARKGKQAAEYFAKAFDVSPMSTSVDPRPLTARKVIESSRRMHTQAYRLERDIFYRNRLQPMTRTEQLEDEAIEPQWFIMDGDRTHRGLVSPDITETPNRDNRTQIMVGHPIMFSEEQLLNLHSLRMRNRERDLKIIVSFTVLESGDLEDIEIVDSTAPNKLNRLLVRALRKVYYRPALLDGVPIATENVRLIQTFYSGNTNSDPLFQKEGSSL